MIETLINIDDWALRKHTEEDKHVNVVTVYAEHVTGCSDKSFLTSASWSWEYDDGVGKKGYEECWKCELRVPKDLVGLVLLYNWGKKGRFDE